MDKTLAKLNNMPLKSLYDFYWLYLYPRGLSLQMSGGKVKGLNIDELIINIDERFINKYFK